MVHIKRFFIPHLDNNYRAHLIQPPAILFYVGILLALQVGFGLLGIVKPGILGVKSNITVNEIISLTNKERVEKGIQPVRLNEALTTAAMKKARDMMAKNYWSHNTPDGKDPWYFISQAGYTFSFAGENLARNFSDSTSVVNAWMASPSHKENLLDERYQEIGVAVLEGFYGNYDTTLVVQMFGTPGSAQQLAVSASSQNNNQVSNTNSTLTENKPQSSLETKSEASAVAQAEKTAHPFESSKITPTKQAFLPIMEVQSATRELPPRNLINPFTATRNLSLILVVFVLALLAIDAIWVTQKKIARISGHTMAHSAFFIIIIIALWLTTAGQII